LRAEARIKNRWVTEQIRALGNGARSVLDVGCGGGFLANALAEDGLLATGLDTSRTSLAVARRFDRSGKARYLCGDAFRLPHGDARFDVVCAMDFLEHVADPEGVIGEASRVLKPGGLFFFHTFNRNLVARIFAVEGVAWFVRNAPRDLHVYRLFIKPSELAAMCRRHGLDVVTSVGMRPVLSRAFGRLLLTGTVSPDVAFRLTPSRLVGYLGVARRHSSVVG
jgi:2-polyprenyl-6-hydroxyphenyl methylase/3-demethylubiquinone-9 3-methyltransferase